MLLHIIEFLILIIECELKYLLSYLKVIIYLVQFSPYLHKLVNFFYSINQSNFQIFLVIYSIILKIH